MRTLYALCAVVALVSCETAPTTAPPDPIPEPLPLVIGLEVDFTCRYHGLNPRFTFEATATPDTVELGYLLEIDQVVPDSAGTFRGTLAVDWGTDARIRAQSVTYTIELEDFRRSETLFCSV